MKSGCVLILACALFCTSSWAAKKKKRSTRGRVAAARCAGEVRNCGRSQNTMQCLTCNAFREAGFDRSIVEVNRTVIARAESGRFPSTNLCGVVYQHAQFSWTFNPRTCATNADWARARRAAEEAVKLGSNGKINFYANYIYPSWARGCSGKQQVGTHIFCNVGSVTARNQAWRQEPVIVAMLRGETVVASNDRPIIQTGVAPSRPRAPQIDLDGRSIFSFSGSVR